MKTSSDGGPYTPSPQMASLNHSFIPTLNYTLSLKSVSYTLLARSTSSGAFLNDEGLYTAQVGRNL